MSAKKLVVYVGEEERKDGAPVWRLVLEACHRHSLAGATATRGLKDPDSPGASQGIPIAIEVVDSQENIDRVLPDIELLAKGSVITVQDVEILGGQAKAEEPAVHHHKLAGRARMLRVHIGANDEWDGEPLHLALLKRFHQLDLAGATVYRGLAGYGASGRIHRRKTWSAGDEPITVVVVDFPQKIDSALPYLDEMVRGGLAVMSDVDVILYREEGEQSP